MLTETLWNGATDREWVFNPLEAGVVSAPTQLPVLCSALHLPKWYRGAHDVMSAVCCLAIQCSLLDGRQVGLVRGSVWGAALETIPLWPTGKGAGGLCSFSYNGCSDLGVWNQMPHPGSDVLPPPCQLTKLLSSGVYQETQAVPEKPFRDKVKCSPGLHTASATLQAPRDQVGQGMRDSWWVSG